MQIVLFNLALFHSKMRSSHGCLLSSNDNLLHSWHFPNLTFSLDRAAHHKGLRELWKIENKAKTIAHFKGYTKEGAVGGFTCTYKFGYSHLLSCWQSCIRRSFCEDFCPRHFSYAHDNTQRAKALVLCTVQWLGPMEQILTILTNPYLFSDCILLGRLHYNACSLKFSTYRQKKRWASETKESTGENAQRKGWLWALKDFHNLQDLIFNVLINTCSNVHFAA